MCQTLLGHSLPVKKLRAGPPAAGYDIITTLYAPHPTVQLISSNSAVMKSARHQVGLFSSILVRGREGSQRRALTREEAPWPSSGPCGLRSLAVMNGGVPRLQLNP